MKKIFCLFVVVVMALGSSGCCFVNFNIAESQNADTVPETEPVLSADQSATANDVTTELVDGTIPSFAVQAEPTQEDSEPVETEPEEKPYVILDRTYIDDANSDVYTWPLYVEGSMPATEIDWISEDTSVATVDAEGRVYAVGEGTTVIRAEYQGQVLATCTILCDFDVKNDDSQESGDTSDEGSGSNYVLYTTYKIQLPYEADKNAYSVTMDHTNSEWMEVYLVNKDNSEDKVMLVWEIVEGDCKLDPDHYGFTATTEENCKLKAVYNGKTYYLIIY